MSNAYDYQPDPEVEATLKMGELAAPDNYSDEPTARITVRPPTVLDRAREQYPVLRGVDLGYTENPNDSGNYLEFWPPGETGDKKAPRPQTLPIGKPGLEVNRADTRPIDVMGDVVSHHLVNTDPKLRGYYQQFRALMTPDQNDRLGEQYRYARQNEGENRPFTDWAEHTGVPAYFRGYAFQQWPAEDKDKYYTPDQLKMFDEMTGYLKHPPSVLRTGPQEDTRMSDALVRMGSSAEPDTLIPPESYKPAPAWATGLVNSTIDAVKTPGSLMAANPYPEGSEEWQWYENNKRGAETQFGGDMALNTMGTGAVVGVPARAGETVLGSGGIRAYHSSPHDFETFDPAKLRTGQGANTYGEGFYFAENPAVSGRGGEYWKEFANRGSSGENTATEYLARAGFDREKAAQTLRDLLANPPEYTSGYNKMTQERMRREALQLLESDKHIGPRTYEVAIDADPKQLLDWDAPLSKQPFVMERFPQALEAAKKEAYSRALGATHQDRADQLWSMVKNPEQATGEFVMDTLGPRGRGGTRSSETSAMLNEAGIPGIRYLNQGSRGVARQSDELLKIYGTPERVREVAKQAIKSGSGDSEYWQSILRGFGDKTHNYVVFPGAADRIRILKKYGFAGAVPTMGALAAYDEYSQ